MLLVGWGVDLVGVTLDRLVDLFFAWWVDKLIGGLVGWLVCWLVGQALNGSVGMCVGDCLVVRPGFMCEQAFA